MALLKAFNRYNQFTKLSRFYSSVIYEEGQQMNEPDLLYKEVFIKVRGHEDQVLESYKSFVATTCHHFELPLEIEVRNKPYFERLVLNRSPFIHKKCFKEYEMRTYEHTYKVSKITGCTLSVFLEYIQRNLPEGVGMTVERHLLETFPDHILKLINSPSLEEPTQ